MTTTATSVRYDRIAVALDTSPEAERAVPVAAALAAAGDIPLDLVSVRSVGLEPYDDLRYLQRLAASVESDNVGVSTLEGDEADSTFRDWLSHHPQALLCMASHGRRVVGQLLFGSVSERLARESTGSLLLVGPGCVSPPSRSGSLVAVVDATLPHDVLADVASRWSKTFAVPAKLVIPVTEQADVVGAKRSMAAAALQLSEADIAVRLSEPVVAADEADSVVAAVSATDVLFVGTHGDSVFRQLTSGTSRLVALLRRSPAPILVASLAAPASERSES